LTGCWQRPNTLARVTGSVFLASGAGLAAVGGPLLLYGASRDGKIPPRRDEQRVRAALVMAGLGLDLLAGGAALAVQTPALKHALPGEGGSAMGTGVLLSVIGGGLLVASLPLGVSGMYREKAPEPPSEPPLVFTGEKKPRLGIAIPGVIVTLLGGGLLVAGGLMVANVGHEDWGAAFVGTGLMIAGGLHVAVGVPLTVVGFIPHPVKAPAPAEPAQTAALPEVRLGPGSLQLRWDF
jgi:hypothetical protein